jgi:hypothetical protein
MSSSAHDLRAVARAHAQAAFAHLASAQESYRRAYALDPGQTLIRYGEFMKALHEVVPDVKTLFVKMNAASDAKDATIKQLNSASSSKDATIASHQKAIAALQDQLTAAQTAARTAATAAAAGNPADNAALADLNALVYSTPTATAATATPAKPAAPAVTAAPNPAVTSFTTPK